MCNQITVNTFWFRKILKKVTSLFLRNLRLNIVNYLQNLYAIFSEENNKRRKETAANNILLH